MDSDKCKKCGSPVTKVFRDSNLIYILCQSLACNNLELIEKGEEPMEENDMLY